MKTSSFSGIATIILVLVAGCSPKSNEDSAVASVHAGEFSSRLYVWAADEDQRADDTDFLSLIDASPNSPAYGEVVATAPVGAVGTGAHHAEPDVPTDALLFANGFDSGRTFLFDLSDPTNPVLSRELESIEGFHHPHSFLRLEDGRLLATLQYGDGSRDGDPGGLAQFDQQGNLLRVKTAADPEFEGEKIRPYSVEAIPSLDRIVTTSRTMNMDREQAADLIQVWRLSDLSLLETLRVPRVPPAATPECILGQGERCSARQYPGEHQPFESRVLADGSILMNTLTCGIYRISDLDQDEVKIKMVINYPDLIGCSVPAVKGNYIILPVIFGQTVLVFDVSDPTKPFEISRFDTPGYQPHWAAADPTGDRIAITSSGPEAIYTVLMLDLDTETGELSLDSTFGNPTFPRAGVSFYREEWPHGNTGTAIPHAALFGR